MLRATTDVYHPRGRGHDIAAIQCIGIEADERFVAVGHPELADGSTIPAPVAEAALADGRLSVAVVDQEVAGWIYTTRIDGELCIGQISVAIHHGQRGIGSALLDTVITEARARGERSIVLNAQADVAWNRAWYESYGFVVLPREQWTPALELLAAEQTSTGLDWTSRIHMRLVLV